ncbi:MAG: lipopolysaccharide transport system permease protein [Arenicella sp.]|jgi:lipopolysaccharide transport system permease protein
MNPNRTVIDANKKGIRLNLRELLKYKDLFLTLAYRDLRVRYAQTFLGFLWAFLQPITTLVILFVVFGRVAKIDTGGVPYPIFAMCGMSAWTYFAFVMNQSGTSIISSQNMIKKIYFPRLIIPLSKAVVGFVDFAITFLLVIILMLIYQFQPSWNIVYLPIFIIITIISALGVGIWLSALTIRYRDFQHIVPFMVQFGLYTTPVAYPASTVVDTLPKWASIIYFMNPMAGVVEGFRWSLIGGNPPSELAYVSFAVIFIIFVSGLFYFRKVEKVMADIV